MCSTDLACVSSGSIATPCAVHHYRAVMPTRAWHLQLRCLFRGQEESDSVSQECYLLDVLIICFVRKALCICRIVMAQLEGSGRGGLGSYNTGAYQDLTEFLHAYPMRDGDAWLELLLKKNEMLGEEELPVPT